MPRPQRIEDHPAPQIRIRPIEARRPDKEFKLKAVQKVNMSWVEWFLDQKQGNKWLE